METLFRKQDRLLSITETKIVRQLMKKINWNAQMIAIRGARGVGKTTLLLQFIKLNYPPYSRDVLYCSMDSVYFTNNTLLDLAEKFHINGGQRLILDEVHKYANWSRELKEIYDLYPDMKIVFTASSLLHILGGDADLSRRCIPYTMQGLSFREFLMFYYNIEIEPTSLDNILKNPAPLCEEVNKKCKPVKMFHEYLQFGYYPFYLRNQMDYYTTIENVASFIIEAELTSLCNVEVANVRKLKVLLGLLATSVPYEVDISKLSSMIGTHRNTTISYLFNLANARLLNLLYSDLNSVKKMQKPDKIYLENPNIIYALASEQPKIETIRECFVVNQLSHTHEIEYSKEGDFRIDGKIIFEVGGNTKTFKQIADLPNSYILAEDIETPYGNKLPIWLIGFLY